MSTPESLDSKTVKKLWDQNHQDKISQSHKKKGTENIAHVIADGIQDNIISDSNYVTGILATARRQNSDTISLLDLAQLFDKATNAEYYATKANQEETLCWNNYGKEFVIQYNDLVNNSNRKIGEKKAKGIIYDKILEHLNIIRERSSISSEINRMIEISTTARRQNCATEILSEASIPMEETKSQHKLAKGRVSDSSVSIDSKTLPETEVSAEKVLPEKLSETISEESTETSVSSNPIHDHAYF
ncbi:42336_t:CDS:2, partial [Gigaspora margarita]